MTRRCLGCKRLISSGSRCNTCANQAKALYSDPEYRRLRPVVLERDEYVCQLDRPGCQRFATTVDHITPVSRGGSNTLENMRAACLGCNSGRRDRAA